MRIWARLNGAPYFNVINIHLPLSAFWSGPKILFANHSLSIVTLQRTHNKCPYSRFADHYHLLSFIGYETHINLIEFWFRLNALERNKKKIEANIAKQSNAMRNQQFWWSVLVTRAKTHSCIYLCIKHNIFLLRITNNCQFPTRQSYKKKKYMDLYKNIFFPRKLEQKMLCKQVRWASDRACARIIRFLYYFFFYAPGPAQAKDEKSKSGSLDLNQLFIGPLK